MTTAKQDEGHHPRHGLDPLMHSPVRLSVLACLNSVDRAEFSFVRDTVETSDSALSKQVAILSDAGYVKIKKGYVGKYPRTWLSLTATGRRAFATHVRTLAAIVADPEIRGLTAMDSDAAAPSERPADAGQQPEPQDHPLRSAAGVSRR